MDILHIFFYILTDGCYNYSYYSIGKLNDYTKNTFYQITGADFLKKIDTKIYKAVNDIKCHPLFWDDVKILNFFTNVFNFIRHRRILEKPLKEEHWIKILPQVLSDTVKNNNKNVSNTIKELLRVLRNCSQHFDDKNSKNIKKFFKDYPGGYICFWTSTFPEVS